MQMCAGQMRRLCPAVSFPSASKPVRRIKSFVYQAIFDASRMAPVRSKARAIMAKLCHLPVPQMLR